MTIAQESPVRSRLPRLKLGGSGRIRDVSRTAGWAAVGAVGALAL